MVSQGELLERLKKLSTAQFEEVLFLLKIDPVIIPSSFAEQSIRAIRVIHWLEQKQEGLNAWKERLLNPPSLAFGKCRNYSPCWQWHWERYQRMIFRN